MRQSSFQYSEHNKQHVNTGSRRCFPQPNSRSCIPVMSVEKTVSHCYSSLNTTKLVHSSLNICFCDPFPSLAHPLRSSQHPTHDNTIFTASISTSLSLLRAPASDTIFTTSICLDAPHFRHHSHPSSPNGPSFTHPLKPTSFFTHLPIHSTSPPSSPCCHLHLSASFSSVDAHLSSYLLISFHHFLSQFHIISHSPHFF